jgi:hypothetical protein
MAAPLGLPGRDPAVRATAPAREFSMPTIAEYSPPSDSWDDADAPHAESAFVAHDRMCSEVQLKIVAA